MILLAPFSAKADSAVTLWIDRPEAQPWIESLTRSALQAGVPVAVLAEVIGLESGFRNIKNPLSSATGFGQQIDGNKIMRVCRLDRRLPNESILGAALELREKIDRTGSLEGAMHAYGTTAGEPRSRVAAILRRVFLAEKTSPSVVMMTATESRR